MLQELRASEDKYFLSGDKPGAGVSICFQCLDALALYQEYAQKGIKTREPFVGNGLWDLGLIDPDGYSLHFESPTEVPEETTYSDWISKEKS